MGSLRLWDLSDQTCRATLNGHRLPIRMVSADFTEQKAVTTGMDGDLRIWNLEESPCTGVLTPSAHQACSMPAVCADFSCWRAISASETGRVYLWDLQLQRLIATLEGHEKAVL